LNQRCKSTEPRAIVGVDLFVARTLGTRRTK
jgi:hypothetical protein